MFSFGDPEAPAKTAAAANKKRSRRVSLADRSRARNDENAMPPSTPRGHRGLTGKGASLQTQQQAFIQAAKKPSALGACPVSTTPSRQGAGGAGGGGGAAGMVNQNIELKRRQKELETMVQGCEAMANQLQEENNELRRQKIVAQADVERASARADSADAEVVALRRDLETAIEDFKAAKAEAAGLRREARNSNTEIASLRQEVATTRDEAARARAEVEATTAKADAAELAAALANEELSKVKQDAAAKTEEAARKAAKALKVEASKAAKATAATAAAQKVAASVKANAAAEIAAAGSRADAAEAALASLQADRASCVQQPQHLHQHQQPQLASLAAGLEKLAARTFSTAAEAEASFRRKPGKQRGRGAAAAAQTGDRGEGSHKQASVTEGDQVGLPELTKQFCGLLAAYTAQDLPLDALVQLIEAAPSLGKRGAAGGDDGKKGVELPVPSVVAEGSMSKPRAAAARQHGSASAAAAPATPSAACDVGATPLAAGSGDGGSTTVPTPVVVVTPPVSTVPTARPTTSRREMLNARRAQQEKEAREKQRVKEEQERQKAERQREARQKRKKEAARQKAAEAAARQQEVGRAAREAAVMASSCAAPLPPQEGPEREQEQEQEQEHANPQDKQDQRKRSPAEEGQKTLPRAQSTKSRRAKQSPPQQHQQQHSHTPTQPQSGEVEPSSSTHTSNSPVTQPSRAAGASPSVGNAEARPTDGATAVAGAAAVPVPPAYKDEVEAFVEEVPMPTGDVDDGFFCADVGAGGVGGAGVGLIVGGGVDDGGGYEMVDAWSRGRDESPATDDSGGASDVLSGGKRKKAKGRPRKVEGVVESSTSPAESAESGEGGDVGQGKEGKKKRRRSMRMVKAPTKFGSEESLAEVVGVPSARPKRDHSKSPELALATPAASSASLGVSGSAVCSAEQTNDVAPVLVSHAPSSSSGDAGEAAGASSARVAPAGAAVDGVTASTSSADSSAVTDSSAAHDSTAQHQAPPAKRKPAATAVGPKRNIRTIRFRGGGFTPLARVAVAAAPLAAAAPLSRGMQPKAFESDSSAAAAAAAGTEAPTPPERNINMSTTAAVAKREVDSLFDTAARKLSAPPAPPSKAAAAKAAGGSKRKPPTGTSKGTLVSAEPSRDPKPKAAAAAKAPATAAAEILQPFGAEVTDGVTTRDVLEAASSRSWVGVGGAAAEEGPRGALTGVLATAQVLMDKHFRVAGSVSGPSTPFSAVRPEAMRHFQSLLSAIVATEACAMRHELRAGAEAPETVPPSASAGGASATTATAAAATAAAATAATAAAATATAKAVAGKRKRVRFFAFDLSTVDMPTDAIEDSDVAAKEVAQHLARVVASAKLLQAALPKRAAGRTSGGGGGGLAAVLKHFMRGLKTIAVANGEPGSSPLVASVRGACLEFGGEISGDVVKRAASFLLQSLESLGAAPEVAARCPLRRRLAGMLSALIRFNLRVLLNPPPPKSVSSLHIEESADRPRKVHEVIQLVSEETKPVNKKDTFDPTRDGATSAVVSRALRRLYGFTDKGAVEVMSAAEAFVADAKSRSDISDEDKALMARGHFRDTVDIVAANRARSFVLELLEFPGVEVAVSQTRGWGELERLSSELREVEDTPDADASLTLLGEVGRLKAWLRQDSPWQHDQRAKACLTRLDEVLVGCDKKEAKRLSQEARRRMWFPGVKSPPEPLQGTGGERQE